MRLPCQGILDLLQEYIAVYYNLEVHPINKSIRIIRVLLPDETAQIRSMQIDAPEFTRHYPRHTEWLDKAITEILEGERVAFGVQELIFDDDPSSMEAKRRLVGSIILKENTYSGIIELKNLFIERTARKKGYGTTVYNAVELYSRKHGYNFIKTEVPCVEAGTVEFLHAMGFQVESRMVSPYFSNENVYIMTKELFPLYNGDIFDFNSQASWILKNHYKLIDEIVEGKRYYEFSIKNSERYVKIDEFVDIRGISIISTNKDNYDVNKDIAFIINRNENLKILFSEKIDKDRKRELEESGIKCLDKDSVDKIFKDSFVYSTRSFDLEDISGMIVLIKPSLFSQMIENIAKGIKNHVYFKGGPIGKYLKMGDALIFMTEQDENESDRSIRGFATIQSVKCGNADDIWVYYKEKSKANPLFDEKGFKRFVAKKQYLIGIEFSDFSFISKIKERELKQKYLSDQKINDDDMGHLYITKNVVDSIKLNSLEKQEKSTIIAQKKKKANRKKVKYDIALSFSGNDRVHAEIIANLLKQKNIRVFYDKDKDIEAELWGKDLYQYFAYIYQNAKYCIIFCSSSYVKKAWTNHELENAQSRALAEKREYILPVRLDDSQIPGIPDTRGYIDLRKIEHSQIVSIVMKKLQSLD